MVYIEHLVEYIDCYAEDIFVLDLVCLMEGDNMEELMIDMDFAKCHHIEGSSNC